MCWAHNCIVSVVCGKILKQLQLVRLLTYGWNFTPSHLYFLAHV